MPQVSLANCGASRTHPTFLLMIGVLATMLAMMAGCPAGAKQSAPERASAGAAAAPSKLPAAEFQQQPLLPPSEPLPKPAEESADAAAVAVPAEPAIAAEAKPQDSSNPLRQADAPSGDNPGAERSAKRADRPPTGKNSGIPFDPIKENGPIFVGWPKPRVAIVITGMEQGYLEPCGCAGLDRMKGGMGRRETLFRQLRDDGWPVVGLDVGGLVQGFGRQAELKFQTAVEAKRKAGYDAIAFGAGDLRLPAGELVAVAASVDDKPSPFVAANVGLLGKPGEITPTCHVVEAGGMKIGVTAVLGKEYQKEIHNDEIEMSDPEAALERIVPELKRQADYLVLLAHATLDESLELARKFPEFNVVVVSDGHPEPPAAPQTIAGTKNLLITAGHKGMDAIVLGLFDDAEQPYRYQRVPLDARFTVSPDAKMLMTEYQEQLKTIGFAGLGLRPAPHPLLETNGRFIGSRKCESCHEESYKIWRRSGHGSAYDTLAKLDPPRNFDPECVSCHVIGWHPTKFFPYKFGYESRETTPHLIDAGCEACHGPGENHAAAELGKDEELQKKLRKAMVVTKAESKKQQCVSCHDLDNSPDFDFDLYWPFVEHYEEK